MEEIYNEYSKLIYNYLLSITNNIEVAEELVQETFYSAVKNINSFRGESSVKTWLYTIAKNKYIDYCKKSKKLKELKIDDCKESLLLDDSFDEYYANKENLLNVCKEIHKLDEKSKEVVYLRIGINFSFKEIGNIIGKSEEYSRTIFYRAKNKLKEELKNGK